MQKYLVNIPLLTIYNTILEVWTLDLWNWSKHLYHQATPLVVIICYIIYINSVSLSVCDGGLGGWGKESRWSSRRPVLVCDGGWTTTVSAPTRCTNQDLISTKHRIHPKGRNDGRIASLSHRTRGGYKNLPLPSPPPPTTERMGGYIEERVFGNFQNLREPRFKMSEPGFWVFSPSLGKGVNTWTNNLRVHTVGSDTRTMLVETTARLGWLEWRSHGCPKVTGTTSYNLFIKYFILNITKT
jgi:hypothetical protein